MGKVIAFSNQKGGSGKSTLSANIAVLWSNSGYKVAVIDADQQKSLTFWLSERKKYYGADDVGIDAYSFETRNLSEEIKKNFRELAKKTHPDKTKDDSEEEMIKINKAYEILSDDVSKERYDRYLNKD